MSYKYIIFDFDGTLVDSADVVSEILNKLIVKHNFTKVTPKELKHKKTSSFVKKIQMILFMAKIQTEFKQLYGNNICKIRLYDGMMQVLQSLDASGYHLVILSSNSTQNIKDYLKNNAIDFDIMILTSRGLLGKHKTIKDYVAHQQCKESEILYIGDEIRDIKACNRTGIDIVFVKWGVDSDEDISNFNVKNVVLTPFDILAFLQEVKN